MLKGQVEMMDALNPFYRRDIGGQNSDIAN
jgi:hypothetical protein